MYKFQAMVKILCFSGSLIVIDKDKYNSSFLTWCVLHTFLFKEKLKKCLYVCVQVLLCCVLHVTLCDKISINIVMCTLLNGNVQDKKPCL